MSPRETDTPETGDELPLAAEFVLGLVQGAERDELERRRRDDYHFAQEVELWEARLGPIADTVTPVEASPHVWERVAQEVGHKPVPLAARPAEKTGLWNSLAFWRSLGIATSALAAACLVFLFTTPASPPPSLVAELQMQDGTSALMAAVDRMTGRVMLMPATDMPAPPEHTHELWLVPTGGGTPISLGTFVADGPVTMDMPGEIMPHAGTDAMLAISVEPMGGSTTGQPTGPVVASGKMHEI